jgi:protein required for attachment to host cells
MIRQLVGVAVMAMALPASALVDFYGYRGAIPKNDSITRYTQTLLGYSELETSEISVTPRGTYLDITEDAWISSDVNKLNITGLTEDFLFKGTIPVPKEATVTGLQTWRGAEMYRAVLKKSVYVADASFDDSVTLQQSLDSRIALLQQHSETTFEITLARVPLGDKVHVRIRYLLRPAEGECGSYAIPVLFYTAYGSNPRYQQFTIGADDHYQSYTMSTGSGEILLNDTQTVMVPFMPVLQLKRLSTITSTMTLTEFTSGLYRGNYMMVNTGVTDSIVKRLSKPIATVFIWRWNDPQPMTTFSNQIKTLSGYAQTVIKQARVLRETINALNRLGNSCALLHSVEGKEQYAFASRAVNTATDTSATAYLASMNEMELYEQYKNEPPPPPDWKVTENATTTEIEQSRTAFISTLTKARDLLDNYNGAEFNHIVVITTPSPYGDFRKDLSESVAEILDSITIDVNGAVWEGVEMSSINANGALYRWNDFRFPVFNPATIQLTVTNAQQPYSFPLKVTDWNNALTFTARTDAAWDTVLQWEGFDAEGVSTRTITEQPTAFRFHADSGLAKLWAGDGDHIAESEAVYPGGTFGILTKSTFLQATTADMAEDVSSTVPFLNDDEIYAPREVAVKNSHSTQSSRLSLRMTSGILYISNPGSFTMLSVFDLQGRLIATIDLQRYRQSGGNCVLPLLRLLKRNGLRMFVIRLSGKGTSRMFNIINGSVQ